MGEEPCIPSIKCHRLATISSPSLPPPVPSPLPPLPSPTRLFVFWLLWRSVAAGYRVRSSVRGDQPLLRTRELIVSRSVHDKTPKRQLHTVVLPLLSLEVATPEIKITHPYTSSPRKRFLVGCSSPFVRFAGHLAALRAWCKQAMSVWSVKTPHAPSRH